jgi:hypothetical protein
MRLINLIASEGICKTIVLPVVLYGCETWSPMLRGEHREQGAEENVWIEERGSDRMFEEAVY